MDGAEVSTRGRLRGLGHILRPKGRRGWWFDAWPSKTCKIGDKRTTPFDLGEG